MIVTTPLIRHSTRSLVPARKDANDVSRENLDVSNSAQKYLSPVIDRTADPGNDDPDPTL